MPSITIRDLARAGAAIRLAELQAERDAILDTFPDLRSRVDGHRQPTSLEREFSQVLRPAPILAKLRRRRFSAAQRRAISVRVRRYWATRKIAERHGLKV